MNNINSILIELDILSKISEHDKIRIREDFIEVDPQNYSRYGYRKMYGDTFEKSILHINNLIEKLKISARH